MRYILKVGKRTLIRVKDTEIILTKEYEGATKFDKIGDAMKKAAEINEELGAHIVKIVSVSSKL